MDTFFLVLDSSLVRFLSIKVPRYSRSRKKERDLTNSFKKALLYFENNIHIEFLQELSKEYSIGKRVLNIEKFKIDSEMLIETLLSHGFRPDGIAYLLNLIGEAFKGGKVRLNNFT